MVEVPGYFLHLKYHISAFLVGRSNLRSAFYLANCSNSNAKSCMSLSRASVKKTGVMYFEHFARNNFYSEEMFFFYCKVFFTCH
jgi:hypothetical protein